MLAPGLGFVAGEMRPGDRPRVAVVGPVSMGLLGAQPHEVARAHPPLARPGAHPAGPAQARDDQMCVGAFGTFNEMADRSGKESGVGHEHSAQQGMAGDGAPHRRRHHDQMLSDEPFSGEWRGSHAIRSCRFFRGLSIVREPGPA